MDPSIEVQITARLDQLDAGLKMAEQKVKQSTIEIAKDTAIPIGGQVRVGKFADYRLGLKQNVEKEAKEIGMLGEFAGSAFVQKMVGNMVKGLAVGAITNVLGGGILNAVKGVRAGKTGADIGLDIARGIVDGAKGIPIAGTIVSILDEIVNGAERVAAEMTAKISQAIEKRIIATQKYMEGLKAFTEKTGVLAGENRAGGDPFKLLDEKDIAETLADEAEKNRLIELEQERSVQRRAEIDAKYKKEGIDTATKSTLRSLEINKANDIEKIRFQHIDNIRKIEDAATARDIERTKAFWAERRNLLADEGKKQEEIAKKTADELEQINQEAEKNYDRFIQGNIDDAKRMNEAKIQAQQDIIDAEQTAQTQASKVGRLDQLANRAAQAFIHGGQTVLGQFNFAQGGAGGQAMALAQKQVASLEKIEAATAEQVRLTKENQGFR